MKHFILSILAVILFFPSICDAGWFRRDPDPDRKPNIFIRMGKGMTDSVKGIFRKEDPIVVLPAEESAFEREPLPSRLPERRLIQEERALKSDQTVARKPKNVPKPISPQEYVRQIQQTILSHTELPEEAKGIRIVESVKVYFVLQPSGSLGKVYIPEQFRSEYGFLNEDAMATVYKAAYDFKPFPSSMDQSKEKLLSIVIKYQN